MNAMINLTTDTQISTILTRQAIQSIEILEFNQDELAAFLQEKAAGNPLVKLSLPRISSASLATHGSAPSRGEAFADLGETLSEGAPPFRSDLLRQLRLMRLSPRQLELAAQLVEALDDDGYLRLDLGIQADILGIDARELEEALGHIQKLEPTGVGARSLKECLSLQLAERPDADPRLRLLLENFELLAQGKTAQLAKLCQIPQSDLPDLLRELRKLSPRPQIVPAQETVIPALPDILVTPQAEGDLRVELNPDLLPKLLIDKDYYANISGAMRLREERSYLSECLQEANLLLRNLAQRAETTLMIATWIVKEQAAFFRQGPKALVPLSQKEIARLAGVHESTVSRAISNRHLLCERGLFPLKYFFSDSLRSASADGDAASANAIRQLIKEMVAEERAGLVLSDDDIAARLSAAGYLVARRTVAKYRGQLRIDSSAVRKRRMALQNLA